jgi:hypothetical protein
VVSRSDARLLKARIAIQISLSGRQSALVRTRVQLIWKLPSDFNRLDDYLSWSRRTHSRYGNCVLKFSRLDAHPPWSGRATVRTMCHPVRTRLLSRKDFSEKFLENPIAQLSVRTAMTTVLTAPSYILLDAHLSPQPINRVPWTLRTARIRY